MNLENWIILRNKELRIRIHESLTIEQHGTFAMKKIFSILFNHDLNFHSLFDP
jgi:hypothetical protein